MPYTVPKRCPNGAFFDIKEKNEHTYYSVKGEGGTFDFPPISLNNPATPFKRVLKRRTAVL